MPAPKDDHTEPRLTILQDWNEVDGRIYYRWKLLSEDEWHVKLTPYTEKPIVTFKHLSQTEVSDLVKKGSDDDTK